MVIILEGLSEVGKTKIAKSLEKVGYRYIKSKNPTVSNYNDKNTYYDFTLEVLLSTLSKYQDIVFDRFVLSELIYSEIVHNRKSLLTEEEFNNLITQIKSQHTLDFYIIKDEDVDQHWHRHNLTNKKVSKEQFLKISKAYDKYAKKYGFDVITFNNLCKKLNIDVNNKTFKPANTAQNIPKPPIVETVVTESVEEKNTSGPICDIDYKINMANVIKKILEKRIIKGGTEIHNILENNVRDFLTDKLSNIFTPNNTDQLEKEEIAILKEIAQKIILKTNGGK